uniref:Uncharacterized protein n=2 Tax=Zea mays TaxID=4577 RepID=A0A804NXV1_MAIZE
MEESDVGVDLGKRMKEDKVAGESGDEGKLGMSHSINLNRVPTVAFEARSTQGNGETHGAAVSGTKDADYESDGQEKLPKCEQVDYESEAEGCLVTLVGNEYCGDEDERVQVLTIVNKDEPVHDTSDFINPQTVVGYSEVKGAVGASATTSAVRPAGSRSSCFHGVTRRQAERWEMASTHRTGCWNQRHLPGNIQYAAHVDFTNAFGK